MYLKRKHFYQAFSVLRSRRRSCRSRLTVPLLPDLRNAFKGLAGSGITLAVAPSTTHSKVVSGPIWSFRRTSAGTDTCPRFVTLVRIRAVIQERTWRHKYFKRLSCGGEIRSGEGFHQDVEKLC